MHGYSARYDAALTFAAQAHRTQLRKGSDIPYIVHVVHVSLIITRHGFDENMAIAALLHDVVEDTAVPLAEVEALFGVRVAQLVAAVTEPYIPGDRAASWEERKTQKLNELRASNADVAVLKAADVIHNARSITNDLRRDGALIWERFRRGPEPTLWYYRSVLDAVRDKLGTHPIALELADAVEDLSSAVRDHA
jgi:(p)ppGpp synthase/HD superfamily hydrolase